MYKRRFAELREEFGYTQAQLAEKLQMATQTMSTWEQGIRMPPVDKLERLADFYGVSVDYILGRTNVRNFSADLEDVEETLRIAEDAKIAIPKTTEEIDEDAFDQYMRAHMDEAVRRYFKNVIFRPEEPDDK